MNDIRRPTRRSPWLESFARGNSYHPLRRVVCIDDVERNRDIEWLITDELHLGPGPGESRNVAVFGDARGDGYDQGQETYPADHLDKLTIDVLMADLTKETELLDILRKYGTFSGLYERFDDRSAQAFSDEKTYDRFADDTMGYVFQIEPLWLLARDIACYRITKQLLTCLRDNHSRGIKAMSRVYMKTDPYFGSEPEWCVEFAPSWLPHTIRRLPEARFKTEPSTREHYLAAGWSVVQRQLLRVFCSGFRVGFTANVPQSLSEAFSEMQTQYAPWEMTHFSDSRECRPPMFRVRFWAQSLREMLYLRLLDEAMQGSYQRQCAICGQPFTPESGKFKYCTHHSEADKKRWLRQRLRDRDTPA